MESKVKLLDFWAAWCGPCKIMHPVIEELEKEYAGRVQVLKYNVDEPTNQAMIEKYQIGAMPTYIIEKDSKILHQFVGAQSKDVLVKSLEEALGN